jgi:hypothetical protein
MLVVTQKKDNSRSHQENFGSMETWRQEFVKACTGLFIFQRCITEQHFET